MENFKLTDDLGTLKTGTKKECLQAFLNWCKSPEAKEIYRQKELTQAITEKDPEFLGFTISPAE